jgi:hypothetical protein
LPPMYDAGPASWMEAGPGRKQKTRAGEPPRLERFSMPHFKRDVQVGRPRTGSGAWTVCCTPEERQAFLDAKGLLGRLRDALRLASGGERAVIAALLADGQPDPLTDDDRGGY